jgi:hypothetical protein
MLRATSKLVNKGGRRVMLIKKASRMPDEMRENQGNLSDLSCGAGDNSAR